MITFTGSRVERIQGLVVIVSKSLEAEIDVLQLVFVENYRDERKLRICRVCSLTGVLGTRSA